MIIHDGIYEWDGKTSESGKPICWWPGSYHLRIVDFSDPKTGVKFLKPYAVLCKNAGQGTSIRNCIENFAARISLDFNIEIEKTLWAEVIESMPLKLNIAVLKFQRRVGETSLYSAEWREARSNEVKLLAPFLKDFGEN
ncbi:MAG: hypothetical protein ACQETC_10720 [Thermodesulfobacteriota bacterium]